MRFLPLRVKRFIWGMVGDYINGLVVLENMKKSAQNRHHSKENS